MNHFAEFPLQWLIASEKQDKTKEGQGTIRDDANLLTITYSLVQKMTFY